MFNIIKRTLSERNSRSLNESFFDEIINESEDAMLDDVVPGDGEDEEAEMEKLINQIPEDETIEDIDDKDVEEASKETPPTIEELAESSILDMEV